MRHFRRRRPAAAAVIDAAGNVVVAFAAPGGGTSTVVRAARRPAGGAFGPAADLSDDARRADGAPRIAMNEAGSADLRFLVAQQQRHHPGVGR